MNLTRKILALIITPFVNHKNKSSMTKFQRGYHFAAGALLCREYDLKDLDEIMMSKDLDEFDRGVQRAMHDFSELLSTGKFNAEYDNK